jgi:hypothetical protein
VKLEVGDLAAPLLARPEGQLSPAFRCVVGHDALEVILLIRLGKN